jgi:hypothetical protein
LCDEDGTGDVDVNQTAELVMVVYLGLDVRAGKFVSEV